MIFPIFSLGKPKMKPVVKNIEDFMNDLVICPVDDLESKKIGEHCTGLEKLLEFEIIPL